MRYGYRTYTEVLKRFLIKDAMPISASIISELPNGTHTVSIARVIRGEPEVTIVYRDGAGRSFSQVYHKSSPGWRDLLGVLDGAFPRPDIKLKIVVRSEGQYEVLVSPNGQHIAVPREASGDIIFADCFQEIKQYLPERYVVRHIRMETGIHHPPHGPIRSRSIQPTDGTTQRGWS